jgi:hypothetical protein
MPGLYVSCCILNCAVGSLLFLVLALLVALQPNFLDFRISDPSSSSASCVVVAGMLFALFVGGLLLPCRRPPCLARRRPKSEPGIELRSALTSHEHH